MTMRSPLKSGPPETVGRPTSPSASVGMAEARAGASLGIVEMQRSMSPQKFMHKIHEHISLISSMPAQKRFEMTQTALLDMHEVVEVHAGMRKRAEAEAAAAKKNKIDLEIEVSRVRAENTRLEKAMALREEALAVERARGKILNQDLSAMTTRSSEHRESAAMFKHQLQKSEEDRHKQAALIQKLQKSEEDLTVKAADQESLIKRLEMKLDMNRERLEKVGKDNKALLHNRRKQRVGVGLRRANENRGRHRRGAPDKPQPLQRLLPRRLQESLGRGGEHQIRAVRHSKIAHAVYRATSLIRNRHPLGPYSRPVSRALRWP
ncbi:hypothetical protein T484DRAFT_2019203 [Baffinella frigidus]|nr:hypothetical protein T484DRAFT_2019203 [Cryptophyta sp. CCMP2293]